MESRIDVEHHGPVAVLTINRPKAYNSFDLETVTALRDALLDVAPDDNVRVVVLTGAGKAFCAGGDLRWLQGYSDNVRAGFHTLAAHLHQCVVEIRTMAKPVIAAINGVAAGAGFSLALGCDFRVMSRDAKLVQAYTSNGLCIDGGGTIALPRLVGHARALEIAAFDRPIDAERAESWGMVTQLAEPGSAVRDAVAMGEVLAARSVHAFGQTKRLLAGAFDSPLEVQLERERHAIAACGAHPDGQEGMAAFTEKRKPSFG